MKKVLKLTDDELKFIILDNYKYKKLIEHYKQFRFQDFESFLRLKRFPEEDIMFFLKI